MCHASTPPDLCRVSGESGGCYYSAEALAHVNWILIFFLGLFFFFSNCFLQILLLTFDLSRSLVLKLKHASELPEGLVKTQVPGFCPQNLLVGLGGARICTFCQVYR